MPAAVTSAGSALNLIASSSSPLPPSRPLDLGLSRKTARAFLAPPSSGARVAVLMPPPWDLLACLQLD